MNTIIFFGGVSSYILNVENTSHRPLEMKEFSLIWIY
jgi:hypothetical protein